MRTVKEKLSRRITAMVLAVLMVLTVIPFDAAANEPTEPDAYEYLKVQNLTAEYNKETKKIDVSWNEITEGADKISVKVEGDDKATELTDPKAVSYSQDYDIVAKKTAGKTIKVEVTATKNVGEGEAKTEESRTVTTNVVLPYVFKEIKEPTSVEVKNDLTIAEIKKIVSQKVPTVEIVVDGKEETVIRSVDWSTEGTTYDKEVIGSQEFTMNGTITLPEDVLNPNNVSLTTSVKVKVAVAESVAIMTDLDNSQEELKVGQELNLSIVATGTGLTYEWYKDGNIISSATTNMLAISDISLSGAGNYYCKVTGKDASWADSNSVTVNVDKNKPEIKLSINPENKQTRPNNITLEALSVPTDGEGTVIFYEGTTQLKKITLPNNNLTATFKAEGSENVYDFSVVYSGDDSKYYGDDYKVENYSFERGNQTITNIKGIPTEAVEAGGSFEIEPVTKLDPESNKQVQYEYTSSDEDIASVDRKGKVTLKKAGVFKITVKAVEDDDYNEYTFETKEITVILAKNNDNEFNFDNEVVSKNYSEGFEFNVKDQAYTENDNIAKENAIYKYEIVSKPSDKIIFDEETGIIKYNVENPKDKDLNEKLVGDVVIQLTKSDSKEVYAPVEATFTLEISKAEQATFSFEKGKIETKYTANQKGEPQTTDSNVAEGGTVNSSVVYTTKNTNIIELNPESGAFVAIHPGTAMVTATKAGNSLYKEVSTTYIVTIEKGEVEGFAFAKDEPTTKFGVQFENVASGGQGNSNPEVSYRIDWEKSSLTSKHVKVDVNGIVAFQNNFEEAVGADNYTIKVFATKAENEYYNEKEIFYDLSITRENIVVAGDVLANGESLKEGWYNLEDVTSHDNKITITPTNEYTLIKQEGGQWDSNIVLDKDDDIHKIKFYLKKKTGETTKLSEETTVQFDKTPATAKLTLGTDDVLGQFLEEISVSPERWHNGNRVIRVKAEDNLSGISKIEYFEQNSNFSKYNDVNALMKDTEIDWTEVKNNENIPIYLRKNQNKKVVVYVKVTDVAGNVSYFRTDGIGFDNITPEPTPKLKPTPIAKIELSDGTEKNLYNGEVPFRLIVEDPTTNGIASGIKTIKVTIKGSKAESYEKVIDIETTQSEISTFDSDNINAAFKIKDYDNEAGNEFVIPENFNSNYLTINVEMKDFAGNYYNNKIENLAIDSIKPEIKVSYNDAEDTFSNGTYIGNNKNRVATINIKELNFENDKVEIVVKRDGESLDIQPNFKVIGNDLNGDSNIWQMQIDYAKYGDGDYEFEIAYTDKAGNSNEPVVYEGANPQAFTIDNTKPVVTVTYDNNSAKNGNYYKADRIATITIEEHNFDASTVQVIGTATDNGKTVVFPTISGWTSNGDIHTATIAYTADAKYTFDFDFKDLADNVIEDYTMEEFYVDKTNPSLEISKIVDESANNAEGNIGFVITAADTNFDIFTPVLTAVVMTENGFETKKLDIWQTHDIENGRVYTVNNIDTDGVYSITCTVTDKAGNDYSEVTLEDGNGKKYVAKRSGSDKLIQFSVNRNGSTFVINQDAEKLIKQYYVQNVTKNVEITEINADNITEYTVTLNGKALKEGTDYTVSLDNAAGGWYKYTYSINKALFEQEGEYNIVVSSKDKATNDAFSDVKGATLKFVVDRTAPVITVTGMKDDGRYQTDKQLVTIIPTDDGGELKSLVVRTVSKTGKELKELVNLEGEELFEALLEGDGKITFEISEGLYQNIQIVCNDCAVDEDGDTNTYDYTFENVSVSSSAFMIFWANKPLRWGTIAGIIVLAGAIIGFVVYKKRKNK